MKLLTGTYALSFALSITALAQTPTIVGVLNNASFARPGTPNADIAQGSLAAVFGTNLGPAGVTQQPAYPLLTTLAGVSAKVSAGGQTFDAIPAYLTANQSGFIIPSKAPVGTATLTVTFNGATSAPFSFKIVPNNFGIYAVNSAGNGPGIVTDAGFKTLGLTTAAKAGDTVIVWGTGLGPVTDDEVNTPPKTADLTNIPVQVYIGGKSATILYRGRNGCCTGLDTIYVTVPAGAESCAAPVVVVVNGTVSNTTTMPIATTGTVCSDQGGGLSSTDLQNLYSKGSFSLGGVSLSRLTIATPGISIGGITLPATTTRTDSAAGYFAHYDATSLSNNLTQFSQSTFGSCIVSIVSGTGASSTPIGVNFLDAGPVINLNGPGGPKQLTKTQGLYSASLGSSFIPDAGGTYAFDNGSGGADVKGFNVSINVTAPVVWSNMATIPQNVPRSQPLTITWTGGDPNTTVNITGVSIVTSPALVATFTCTERASAHTFTIPSYVLLQLPPSEVISAAPGVSFSTSYLGVGTAGTPVKFTATGIDQAMATWTVISGRTVTFQ